MLKPPNSKPLSFSIFRFVEYLSHATCYKLEILNTNTALNRLGFDVVKPAENAFRRLCKQLFRKPEKISPRGIAHLKILNSNPIRFFVPRLGQQLRLWGARFCCSEAASRFTAEIAMGCTPHAGQYTRFHGAPLARLVPESSLLPLSGCLSYLYFNVLIYL